LLIFVEGFTALETFFIEIDGEKGKTYKYLYE